MADATSPVPPPVTPWKAPNEHDFAPGALTFERVTDDTDERDFKPVEDPDRCRICRRTFAWHEAQAAT